MSAIIVVDAFWGDSGKGKIAACGARTRAALTPPVWQLVRELENRTGIPVTLVETGKYFEDIVDLTMS